MSVTEQQILTRLFQILRDSQSVIVSDPNARIREGVRVDGDDAEEFFEELEEEFGYTAWRENMYDFFQDEYSCGVWPGFKRWLLNRQPDLPSLTLRDIAFCVANNIPLQVNPRHHP